MLQEITVKPNNNLHHPRSNYAAILSPHLWRAPFRIAQLGQEPLVVSVVLVGQSSGLPVREDKTKLAKGQDEVGLPYLGSHDMFPETGLLLDMLIRLGGMEFARQHGGGCYFSISFVRT